MNEQQKQLVDYIQKQIATGIPAETIRATLQEHNWPAEQIEQALGVAQQQDNVPPMSLPAQALSDTPTTAVAAPQKYKVFRAIGDTIMAIRNNTVGFILAAVTSYALVVGTIVLIVLVAVASVTPFVLSGPSSTTLVFTAIAGVIAYIVVSAAAGALVLSTTSLALSDGIANRKSSLGTILSNSLKRLWRIVMANALFAIIVALPMLLAPVILLAVLMGGNATNTPNTASLLLGSVLILVAVIWAIIAMLRYALVPYIALFEPDLPLKKILARSSHLLKKGGQWFLVKGVLLIFVLLMVAAVLTGQSVSELDKSNNILLNIVFIIMSVLANGALVMLYHNRRAVKDAA